MSYILLGCPRSGTNLLSSLLKHAQGSTLLVEPFSMALPWVLRDDLYRLRENEKRLRCRCGTCYVCDLRTVVRHHAVSFKETSLFEYLDVLVEEFGVDRIVYLERDPSQVADSYAKHELWQTWDLETRRLAGEFSDAFTAQGAAEKSRLYGELATELKRSYWRAGPAGVPVKHVSFDALMDTPADTLDEVFDFLDLRPKPYLRDLIASKFRKGPLAHVYATFPHPAAAR